MIKFHCPHCREPLEAKEHVAGEFFRCPECDKRYLVPQPVQRQSGGCLGRCLAILGTVIVLYFFLGYQTTVPIYDELPANSPLQRYVYNTGKMHNQTIGVITGFGFLAVGVAFCIAARFKRPQR